MIFSRPAMRQSWLRICSSSTTITRAYAQRALRRHFHGQRSPRQLSRRTSRARRARRPAARPSARRLPSIHVFGHRSGHSRLAQRRHRRIVRRCDLDGRRLPARRSRASARQAAAGRHSCSHARGFQVVRADVSRSVESGCHCQARTCCNLLHAGVGDGAVSERSAAGIPQAPHAVSQGPARRQ